jgi:hypothetical protein
MKIKLIVIFCTFAFITQAQTVEETKTIFGNKKPHIGYFINPFIQIGEIAGFTSVLPGIGAGVTFNNKLTLELSYKFIANEYTPVGEIDKRLYLDQKYGALKFEYSFFPTKAVHLNLPVDIGIGHTELDLKDSYESDSIHTPNGDAWFAYIEPGLSLEINLIKYLKFNIGAGYRIISSVSYRSLSEKDIMGFTFSTGFKIGIF